MKSKLSEMLSLREAYKDKSMPGRFPLIFAGIYFSLLGCGQASPIAADAFFTGGKEYVINSPLYGQNPPSSIGFEGPWSYAQTALWEVVPENLQMSGVTNGGGSLKFNALDSSTYSREVSRRFTSSSGQDTLWFGGLFQGTTKGLSVGTKSMVGFLSGSLPNNVSSTIDGAAWTDANGGTLSGFAWGVVDGKLTVAYQSNPGTGPVVYTDTKIPLLAETTYFIVGELIINSDGNKDTLNLWVETSVQPDAGSLGPAQWSIKTADIIPESASLNTVVAFGGVSREDSPAFESNQFDAVTLGTAYSDLLAIRDPEVTGSTSSPP